MKNVELATYDCIKWIKNWFENNSGNAKGIVVGISGGKDSTVVAKLCCEAIWKEKVFGVLMPHTDERTDDSLVNGKKFVNMGKINYGDLTKDKFCLSNKTKTNIPPRIRMTVLYAIGQEIGYRVAGTGNLSESTIGWCTKWGDTACDFNPIRKNSPASKRSVGGEMNCGER